MNILHCIPQIIYVILVGIEIAIAMVKHGELKDSDHNFWKLLITTLFTVGLLILGGFFSTIGVPQIIYIFLAGLGFAFEGMKHGQPDETPYSIGITLVGKTIQALLFLWGGFFNVFLGR